MIKITSVKVGDIRKSNKTGYFIITRILSYKEVYLTFLKTGYRSKVQVKDIEMGCVKDPIYPSIYGVAYIGAGKRKTSTNKYTKRRYSIWHGMIARCYDPIRLARNPTYKDCIVCDQWLNYQVFSKWYDDNYITDYHLDKDIKVKGNKIYSPDRCMFVSQKVNIAYATKKQYKMNSPENKVVDINNLSDFCRENNLNRVNMHRVISGIRRSHKGWTMIL